MSIVDQVLNARTAFIKEHNQEPTRVVLGIKEHEQLKAWVEANFHPAYLPNEESQYLVGTFLGMRLEIDPEKKIEVTF